MCKFAYIQFNERTGKDMIFCMCEKNQLNSQNLCLCQRFCPDKSRYIPHNQDMMHCKFYED